MSETLASRTEISDAAGELSRLRGRPCLIVDAPLQSGTIGAVRGTLGNVNGPIDVILRSPGGCGCCAYQVARDLRRCCDRVGVFVPLAAKSAATMVALIADELVLGDQAELGPLDAQFSDRQRADFPVDRSRLEVFSALDQLRKHAVETFDEMVRAVAQNSGMRCADVCRIGTEFVARICQPLYEQIDPFVLGQSVRGVDAGAAYAERLLRRYRPEVWASTGPHIVERLVKGYPDHGFVIDREELEELGVPVRAPSTAEGPLVERLATALQGRPGNETFVDLIVPFGSETACRHPDGAEHDRFADAEGQRSAA
jgi:hypothetical protein